MRLVTGLDLVDNGTSPHPLLRSSLFVSIAAEPSEGCEMYNLRLFSVSQTTHIPIKKCFEAYHHA